MSFNFEFTGVVPEDLWIDAGRMGQQVNPKYDAVIWATLNVGINNIADEATAQKMFRRLVMDEASTGIPNTVTLDTLRQCIGLTTNAPALTDAKFKSRCAAQLVTLADNALKKATVQV